MPRRRSINDRIARQGVRLAGAGQTIRPEPKLPTESERQFQAAILEAAKVLRWRTYHTWSSMHSASGFPDLVLVRRPRVIFAELKSETGQVSEDQQAWIDDLRASGQRVFVWRPSDWDEIVEELTAP